VRRDAANTGASTAKLLIEFGEIQHEHARP
jgi:hypothetical protein